MKAQAQHVGCLTDYYSLHGFGHLSEFIRDGQSWVHQAPQVLSIRSGRIIRVSSILVNFQTGWLSSASHVQYIYQL